MLYKFEADVRHETEKAYLISVDGSEELWIPKSQITAEHPYKLADGLWAFEVPEWLAKAKNLV